MKNLTLCLILLSVSSFWAGYFWPKQIEERVAYERVLKLPQTPPICEEDINPFAAGSYVNVIRCGKGKYKKFYQQKRRNNVSPDNSQW